MDPLQVTLPLISAHGAPSVLNILDNTLVNFPNGEPGWILAKEFAIAGVLESEAARAKVARLDLSKTYPQEFWEEVAKLEGLEALEQFCPDVVKRIQDLNEAARLTSIAWDQATYDSTRYVLRCCRDSGPNATCYPLLEGDPGASKTQIAMLFAALVQRPVYPVVGGDGASDEIKATLMGGPYPSDKAPWAVAKDYAYQGVLKHSGARRRIIGLLKEYASFEAIPQSKFQELAVLEGLRDGITYDKKGSYQLAAAHGGILLLEESNSFPAEVHSLLTQVLENYIHGRPHPNFFAMATQNPAGEKHPSRSPLPGEVVNRFSRYRVLAPGVEQYVQFLNFLFTGEQPQITLSDGKKGSVTPRMLGRDIDPQPPHALSRYISRDGIRAFIRNLAAFHKNVETQIYEGRLDPKESQEPLTRETAFISRRDLRRLINGIQTEIHTLQFKTVIEPGQVIPWSALNLQRSFIPPDDQIVEAITQSLQHYYIIPNSFMTNQALDVKDKDQGVQVTRLANTREQLQMMLKEHKLSTDALNGYIISTTNAKELEARFDDNYKKDLDTINRLMAMHATKRGEPFTALGNKNQDQVRAHYLSLNAQQQKLISFIPCRSSSGEWYMTLAYIMSASPFLHAETVMPKLMLANDDKEGGSGLAEDFNRRGRDLSKRQLRYPFVKEMTEWLKPLIGGYRTEPEIYATPCFQIYTKVKSVELAVGIPPSALLDKDASGNLIEPAAGAPPPPTTYTTIVFSLFPRGNPETSSSQLDNNLLYALASGETVRGTANRLKLGKNNTPKVGLQELVILDLDLKKGKSSDA